jgi:hypothetical protein
MYTLIRNVVLMCSPLLLVHHIKSHDALSLKALADQAAPLFQYPLNIVMYPAAQADADVMLCCHGYGGNGKNAKRIHMYRSVPHHILSFDFPDARILSKAPNPHATSFGTIAELLPMLAIIKSCVIDGHVSRMHLYGFSAGGAAVINTLAVLHAEEYDAELAAIGITTEHKQKMLAALQAGHIILDSPLKSMEEIIALHGMREEFDILAQRYAANNLRPIDTIKKLAGLSLTVMLYFQNPDEIVSNRDDQLFYDILQSTLHSTGTVLLVQADDGGHSVHHASLWRSYEQMLLG